MVGVARDNGRKRPQRDGDAPLGDGSRRDRALNSAPPGRRDDFRRRRRYGARSEGIGNNGRDGGRTDGDRGEQQGNWTKRARHSQKRENGASNFEYGRRIGTVRGSGNNKRTVDSRSGPKRSGLKPNRLASRIVFSKDDNGDLLFHFDDINVIRVSKDGSLVLHCPASSRNADTMCVANLVLRPLGLQITSFDSRNVATQWYVTDGRKYKVKVLENASFNGPDTLETFKSRRSEILEELVEAQALFVELESTAAVLDGVSKLFALCVERGWKPPQFKFNKVRKKDETGFVFKVFLPQFGIEIPPSMDLWDSSHPIAKNKSALKAVKTLESLASV